MCWRYQICFARFLYFYRDNLLENAGKTIAKEWKKYTSGGCASLQNTFDNLSSPLKLARVVDFPYVYVLDCA